MRERGNRRGTGRRCSARAGPTPKTTMSEKRRITVKSDESSLHSDDVPLAYLITFSCYGTWLCGDERGSVDRHHNLRGTAILAADSNRVRGDRKRMTQPAYELEDVCRDVVLKAIREVCEHRQWPLLALHVRTKHVHSVVASSEHPERVMNDLSSIVRACEIAVVLRVAISSDGGCATAARGSSGRIPMSKPPSTMSVTSKASRWRCSWTDPRWSKLRMCSKDRQTNKASLMCSSRVT